MRKKKEIKNLAFAKKNLFEDIRQPKKSKGLFVYIKKNSENCLAYMLPLFRCLILKAWSVIIIDDDEIFLPKIRDVNINFDQKLSYNISKIDYLKNIFNFFKINHDNKEFNFKNINYYGTIINSLGKRFKVPTYDKSLLKDPLYNKEFLNNVIKTCRSVKICEELFRRNLKIPVFISGVERSYVPTGVFQAFCIKKGYKKNIHFLNLTPAYDNISGYIKKVIKKIFFNISSIDQLNGNCVDRKKYEKWLIEKKKIKKLKADYITLNNNYKNIYIFLNFPYDIPHPWVDDGYIHNDMIDFAIDTIKIAKELKFKRIFLKLHPRESHDKLFGKNVKSLKELFLEYDVEIIDKNTRKNKSYYKNIDIAVVWRSNVYMELIKNKIPTIVCGKYPAMDKVFDYIYPKNRQDYYDLLSGKKKVKIGKKDLIKKKYFVQSYKTLFHDFDFARIPKISKYPIKPLVYLDKIKKVRQKIPRTYVKIFDAISNIK